MILLCSQICICILFVLSLSQCMCTDICMCIFAAILDVFWTHHDHVCSQQWCVAFVKLQRQRVIGRERRAYLMKPSLRDKESHQSPWCVTWPGPCHHRAPVVAKKYPPLPPHTHPQLLSFIAQPRERERERERWGDS